MKKFLSAFLVCCLFGLNLTPAFAATKKSSIKDVGANHWAKQEIERVVADSIMATDENGDFLPEKDMTRVEFVHALLKVLSNDTLDVNIKNSFKDVKDTDYYYADILRSQQLGLVYGYPNKTFQPDRTMLRAETTSVISHITKDKYVDCSVLDPYTDKNTIPAWAKLSYAKSIHYGIFVNHPDANALEPNRNITRAEAAVLLSQLKDKLSVVKTEYIGPKEEVLAVEHLSVTEKAPCNTVLITNLRKVISKGNVLVVAFDSKFESKKHAAGDIVSFVLPDALYTDEGTFLLPAQSKVVAEIIKITPAKKFNKNARVSLIFRQIVLPDGTAINIAGRPFTKEYVLMEGPWMTAGKLILSTLTFGAVGAGAGIGFAFIPNPAKFGVGLAIGIPVGCTVGLVLGLLTPGLNYKAKAGEQVMVLLMNEASIKNNK